MTGGAAVAGARVHQEVLGRNGVPQEDEVTVHKLSCEWLRAALGRQPGTGRAAMAGGGAKPLVIITNVRRCSRVRRVAWQSGEKRSREVRQPREQAPEGGRGAVGASTSRVTGGPAGGDWRAKLGAGAVERDRAQSGGGGSMATSSFAGGQA